MATQAPTAPILEMKVDCSSMLCTSSAEDCRGLCKMLEYRCLVLRIVIESLSKESPHKLQEVKYFYVGILFMEKCPGLN